MSYKTRNIGPGLYPNKVRREKFLTLEEVYAILHAIEKYKEERWRRDHAMVFFGFYLGLRVSECSILERDCFKDLKSRGVVYVTRLKRMKRIDWICSNPDCRKKLRVSAKRIGKNQTCPKCETITAITSDEDIPEDREMQTIPFVETHVAEYAHEYLDRMRPDQRYLIESYPGTPCSSRMIRYCFKHYARLAGLSPVISYHALRHGRGAQLYDLFQDQLQVKEMLGHASLHSSEFYMHLTPQKIKDRRAKLDSQHRKET